MQGKSFTIVNFHARFRDLLDSSGQNQKEIAAALTLSEGAIVNYKRDRLPKAEELLRISKYFGVSLDWLLTGATESTPVQELPPSYGERSKKEAIRALRAAAKKLYEEAACLDAEAKRLENGG